MSIIFILLTLLVILLLLFISAFFSGSETALTAVSKARMHHASSQGDQKAIRVMKLLQNKERLLGTLLLGNNLVNIMASALSTTLLLALFGDAGVIYATLGLTLIVVIFAEVLPKSYAIVHTDKIARLAALPMLFLIKAFRPITWLIQHIVRFILFLLGLKHSYEFNLEHHEEELRGAIDLHRGDDPDIGHERHMMKSILDLDESTVEDVMTHRRGIEMVDLDAGPSQVIEQIMQSRFTRIPLYRGDQDNIIGVIHAKSLLKAIQIQQKTQQKLTGSNGELKAQFIDFEAIDIEKLANTPWFIPDSTSLMDQLLAFRERREHFSIVVDEYGSVMGVVTLEDILEEIVGNIDDETDIRLAGVKSLENGSFLVDGSVTLRTLERELEWNLPNDEAVTIAGLILNEARRIPNEGQVFLFYNYKFEVIKRVRNQIREVIITPPVKK